MNWKPEFLVEGKWCSNSQVFATEEEARKSAYSRFFNWYVPTDYRAAETSDPVNYRWDEKEGDVHL